MRSNNDDVNNNNYHCDVTTGLECGGGKGVVINGCSSSGRLCTAAICLQILSAFNRIGSYDSCFDNPLICYVNENTSLNFHLFIIQIRLGSHYDLGCFSLTIMATFSYSYSMSSYSFILVIV